MKVMRMLFLPLAALLIAPPSSFAADPTPSNSPSLNTQLQEAVQFLDVVKVKELLKSGADASYHGDGRSLLGWAAQNGNEEIVEALLAAKAEPDFVDTVGHTPLIRAIETRHPAIVEALLKGKANPNFKTPEGKTALMFAVESQTPEIVSSVIKAGADVQAVTPEGDSPALTAAQDGLPPSLEIIKILGEAKANLNASNLVYTPLVYAVQQENKELVRALLNAGADPNAKTQSGQSPLQAAAYNSEISQTLLQAKADPNITNDRGESALMNAIGGTVPLDYIKTLIAAGADINKKDNNGTSPLQLANNLYKPEIVALLKEHGAVE